MISLRLSIEYNLRLFRKTGHRDFPPFLPLFPSSFLLISLFLKKKKIQMTMSETPGRLGFRQMAENRYCDGKAERLEPTTNALIEGRHI